MIGQTISHYRITAKLGEGGMGVVWKARDTRLDRDVALKFFGAHLTEDPEGSERFVREARAAAALDHPNICTVHEIDEADGRTFLVMAFVEGRSLSERIAERPLPLNEALDIAIQVAGGLHAAHKKGIVHRDIKSANIMVDAEGRAKIMDFGLAHLTGHTKITQEGTTLGTPAYMSPEQVRGEVTDQRTDIWSLGVVLYEMITGRLPFRGDRTEAVSHSILYEEAEPLTALRTDVPIELDRAVGKMLAKKPAERFQHVDELIVDLRRVVRESEGGRNQQDKKERFRRRTLLAAAVAAIVIVITAVLAYFRAEPASKRVSVAVLPLTNLSGDPNQEHYSVGLTDGIIGELAKIPSLRVTALTSVRRFQDSNLSMTEIARQLRVGYLVTGSVIRGRAEYIRISVQLIDAASREGHLWSEDYERESSRCAGNSINELSPRAIACRVSR